jgi:microcompartment protein CcmK/EutM
LKIWDDEIKLIVQQKNLAYKKYLQTKSIDNETEYKRRRAIAKTELGKDITDRENNLYHT